MAKEASAGNDSGRMILAEDLEVAGAVDLRDFDHVLRQAGHVAAQQVDGERQAEAGMRQPDAEIGLRRRKPDAL